MKFKCFLNLFKKKTGARNATTISPLPNHLDCCVVMGLIPDISTGGTKPIGTEDSGAKDLEFRPQLNRLPYRHHKKVNLQLFLLHSDSQPLAAENFYIRGMPIFPKELGAFLVPSYTVYPYYRNSPYEYKTLVLVDPSCLTYLASTG